VGRGASFDSSSSPLSGNRCSRVVSYHEELESLVKHIPTLKMARFLDDVFRELHNPSSSTSEYWYYALTRLIMRGRRCQVPQSSPSRSLISCGLYRTDIDWLSCSWSEGGKERRYYVTTVTKAYREVGAQAVYTTGVPAV